MSTYNWKKRGVRILDDLLNSDGELLSYTQFKTKFRVQTTYLDYLGLMKGLPKNWQTQPNKNK